jgi:hypothetical protein
MSTIIVQDNSSLIKFWKVPYAIIVHTEILFQPDSESVISEKIMRTLSNLAKIKAPQSAEHILSIRINP